MAVKNNRRTLLTKRLLKDSLLELLQTESMAKITIKDICENAEMSRSTFYLHYQDQYALLEDIENDVLDNTFESLKNLDTDASSIESIAFFLDYVKSNKETFGILLCNPENASFQKKLLEKVASFVQTIIPANYVDEREQVIYTFVMHGSANVLVNWINNGFNIPVTELATLIYQICSNVVLRDTTL